ncbi:hypothetical protein V1503_08995 [Bacillus sp. SCS-151]|uniref:hypothetical protein n=1 Tax=Nanhaiella sioensis TaxID=3115293 RepID=UPI00397DEBD0
MFVELINNIFPYIFSLSLLITTALVVSAVLYISKKYVNKHQFSNKEYLQSIQLSPLLDQQKSGEVKLIQHWINSKVKRKEAPDDDSDCFPVSLRTKLQMRRGGKLWYVSLYSQFLRKRVVY